jgi:hypothetical protein
LDPRDTLVMRWRSACIVFLVVSFFQLPLVLAFGESIVIELATDV